MRAALMELLLQDRNKKVLNQHWKVVLAIAGYIQHSGCPAGVFAHVATVLAEIGIRLQMYDAQLRAMPTTSRDVEVQTASVCTRLA